MSLISTRANECQSRGEKSTFLFALRLFNAFNLFFDFVLFLFYSSFWLFMKIRSEETNNARIKRCDDNGRNNDERRKNHIEQFIDESKIVKTL